MELPNLKLPDLSSLITPPPIIPHMDLKTNKIVSAILITFKILID